MKTCLILGAAALALAACGSGHKAVDNGADGETAAGNVAAGGSTTAEPSAAAPAGGGGEGNLIRPGEWEMKVEAVDVDAPGMPAQVKQMMASAMAGTKKTIRECITPEQARRPSADVFTGNGKSGCTSKDFSTSGGRLHGTINCPAENGGGMVTLTMDGQFNPEGYTASQTMVTEAAGSKITIKARVSGRRVGECSADSAKEG
jgi:hypothetical protein